MRIESPREQALAADRSGRPVAISECSRGLRKLDGMLCSGSPFYGFDSRREGRRWKASSKEARNEVSEVKVYTESRKKLLP